ncbi:MAG: ATP-binding cassette domain-containing protein [Rhodobiaceae bacterium]|nr:ATP-binding cassette domain-containing protein [Rhodobiaceae bacterium]
MRPLLSVFRRMARARTGAFGLGLLLSALVLLAGVALLGLSGWFITAAAMAGLAGTGAVFDVFRPSAAIRFLALGRTAARYGERLATHDATLKALADLRVGVLDGLSRLPFPRLSALRGADRLNRLTLDIDALDGVALRLVLPVGAALATWGLTAAVLWWLTDLRVVLWTLSGFGLGAVAAFVVVIRHGKRPSRLAHAALMAYRTRLIDLMRARTDLIAAGLLGEARGKAADAERRHVEALLANDMAERGGGMVLALAETTTLAGILVLGGHLVLAGTLGPAAAALAFFAVLALGETLMPLRRGLAEFGRMADAARRVEPLVPDDTKTAPSGSAPPIQKDGPVLSVDGVAFGWHADGPALFENLTFSVARGGTVALVAPSGRGKSTVLQLAAGVLRPRAGELRLFGAPLADWPEDALRARVMLLPQRSALMAMTVAETLRLADPDATDADLREVLDRVSLTETLAARGGLAMRLGEAGSGLSGGERRRLALARALLRRPSLLLLDEPTEGLDRPTADQVLAGIRQTLPDAAILVASHRDREKSWADRQIRLP